MTDRQKEKMQELRAQGLGYKSISKTLGIPIGSVTSFFNRIARKENIGVCRNCGVKIRQTKGHRRRDFCCERCRYEWRKHNPEKRNLKAYYKSTCLCCGREFQAYGNSKRKYCSRACYLVAHTKGGANDE
ncbi:MAG: RNA polymerase subunit sigma-70 [Lachnospiraceae bacterium]|nr:RNA polymerase subunit sigma-70 [Lachnospiraceae bacterium]